MRNLFPGHYRLKKEELEALWDKAYFVFDTNVLLDLYSYPEEAREIFLSALRKIKHRIWIPYQVAFEFHKNRFNRIRSSNEAVQTLQNKLKRAGAELEKEFEDIEFVRRNTGIEDISARLQKAKSAYDELIHAVDLACARLPVVGLDDPIADQISELFEGKVGLRPKSKEEMDELTKDGDIRYEADIPPGFADKKKNGNYRDGGIIYPEKFGDLICWRQTLFHAKENAISSLIFVTGDKKKDWWWIENGETLGPHPSLVEDFMRGNEAELFWMYTGDQFLKFAGEYLKVTEVTAKAVEQVKSTSELQRSKEILDISSLLTKKSVAEWPFITGEKIPNKIKKFPKKNIHHVIPKMQKDELLPIAKWLKSQHPSEFGLVRFSDNTILVHGESGWHTKYIVEKQIVVGKNEIVNAIFLNSNLKQLNYPLYIIFLSDAEESDRVPRVLEDCRVTIEGAMGSYGINGILFGNIVSEIFNLTDSLLI